MSQVKEVLRRWLHADEGVRRVAIGAGVDRKTAQRYIDAAQVKGTNTSISPVNWHSSSPSTII